MSTTKISSVEKIVYYIIKWCDENNLSNKLGTVKLNKILWFSDKYYYKKELKSLTGTDFYYKKIRGPVYPHLDRICKDMERKKLINIEKRFTFTKFTANPLPDTIDISFDKRKQDIIIGVSEIICKGYTSDEISEESHGTIWNIVDMNDKIPVYASLADDGAGILTEEDIQEATSRVTLDNS